MAALDRTMGKLILSGAPSAAVTASIGPMARIATVSQYLFIRFFLLSFKPEFPFFNSWPAANIPLIASACNSPSGFRGSAPPATTQAHILLRRTAPKLEVVTSPDRCLRHFSVPCPIVAEALLPPGGGLSRWQGQQLDPPQHGPEQPSRQMTLRKQQPVVAGVLHQPAARLHQPLLQAGQRPLVDSFRQHQT